MGNLIGVKSTSHPLKAAIAHLRDFINGAEQHLDRGVSSVDLPVDRAGAKALRRLLDLADHGRNSRQRATALVRELRHVRWQLSVAKAQVASFHARCIELEAKPQGVALRQLEVSQGTCARLEKELDLKDAQIRELTSALEGERNARLSLAVAVLKESTTPNQADR